MNESGCAFVCFILASICAILSWYSIRTGDWEAMTLIFWFALIVLLLAAFVIVCKYVP